MQVGSYLELYTTFYGWQQYGRFVSVLSETGIVFLPFLGLVIEAIKDPMETMNPAQAVMASLRRLEVNFIMMMLVIVIAFQPTVPFEAGIMEFNSPCKGLAEMEEMKAGGGKVGDTGTTFDSQFSDINSTTRVRIPIWWMFVMSVSHGITHAGMESFDCPANAFDILTTYTAASITDREVAKEVNRFKNECYGPARSQLDGLSRKDDPASKALQKMLEDDKNLKVDLGANNHIPATCMNGKLYMEFLYPAQRARDGVQGFPYSASRDTDMSPTRSVLGHPFCDEWWKERLRDLVVEQVDENLRDRLEEAMDNAKEESNIKLTEEGFKESLACRAIAQTPITDPQFNLTPTVGEDPGIASRTAANLGAKKQRIEQQTMIMGLKNTIYSLQAFVLMAIYAALPFVLIAGRYQLQTVVLASLGVFTVIFMSYWWHMAWWIEQKMIFSMFQEEIKDVTGQISGFGNSEAKMIMYEILVFSLYALLPMVFIQIMVQAGIKVNGMSSLGGGINKGAQDTGQGGGQVVGGAVNAAAKSTVKKLTKKK
jgi:hypothetical protein